MRTQANGIGVYRRKRSPNGAGMTAAQSARMEAAQAECARRRAAEQAAKEQSCTKK